MQAILQYAKEHNVPIIEKEGLDVLIETIQTNNCKSILEIGSAIGYSSINMALISNEIKVTTLEIDPERYSVAKHNIERFKLNEQIDIHLVDGLQFQTDTKFDFIFIDAAKAQYTKFFNLFKDNLKPNGIIFSDNLNFHGYVKDPSNIKSRNLRQLVRKINSYVTFLKDNDEFETNFVDKGDGIAISYLK